MSEQQSFLDALNASPHDDTTRLVYADWLDERGDAGRAAYLRLVAAARGAEDLTPAMQDLCEAGEEFDAAWRDEVAARFEIVYLGAAQSWEHYILHALERAFRCNRVDLAPLRHAAPAVLYDRLSPDAAVQAAESWTDECVRMIAPPGQVASEFSVDRTEMLWSQLGDARGAWFAVRPMGASVPPHPSRFEVVVTGRFDALMSQPHLDPSVYVPPLRAVYGLTEDDVQWMMYSGGSVPVRRGLSFADALATDAEFNKVLKRHTMGRTLRELASVEVRPEPAPEPSP